MNTLPSSLSGQAYPSRESGSRPPIRRVEAVTTAIKPASTRKPLVLSAPAPSVALRWPVEPASSPMMSLSRPIRARLVGLLLAAFIVIQISDGIRLLVHLVNANPDNAVVGATIGLTNVLVAPFDGIFQSDTIMFGGGELDLVALLALICYPMLLVLVFWALNAVGFLSPDQ